LILQSVLQRLEEVCIASGVKDSFPWNVYEDKTRNGYEDKTRNGIKSTLSGGEVSTGTEGPKLIRTDVMRIDPAAFWLIVVAARGLVRKHKI
jgi:hypothetical protein